MRAEPSSESDIVIEDEYEEDELPTRYDIASYPSDYTLRVLRDMWYSGDIIIPDFQRGFVWPIKRASLLMESFLFGLPVPPIFFYIDDQNKNLVIDGHQRIQSIVYYLEGFFGPENEEGRRRVFRLNGIDERSPYHNLSYSDLEPADQRKIDNSVLRSINIRQLNPTDSSSMYHIFERLNTGGIPLKPQEVRNCVYGGKLNSDLKALKELSPWRLIIGSPKPDKHQRDVELVLRIFALSRTWKDYEKPMKEHLNRTMSSHRRGRGERVQRFVNEFPQACETIVNLLGEKPFHPRGPLNAAVLDSVYCTVLESLHKLPKDLRQRYERLLEDGEYVEAIGSNTTDTQIRKKRFESARRYLVG